MSDEMHVGEVQGEACEEVLPGICDLFAGQVPEKEQEVSDVNCFSGLATIRSPGGWCGVGFGVEVEGLG